jgi:hypothetical protein
MRAAWFVEGILRRVTTRDRASAIVGDLVEMKEQKGAVWFWLAAAGVLFSLVWRWPIAFVASFYAGAWSFEAFLMATVGIHAQHIPEDYPWAQVLWGIVLAGSCAIALGVFAGIRYGLHERATQMVSAWATLAAAVIYLWWVPAVLVTCIASALALGLYSVCAREGRRASVVAWPAIVMGVCGFFWWAAIGTLYQNWLKPGLRYCGKVSLETLAKRFGTPLYVYSADQIVERLGLFQQALHGREHLVCYAVKANSALAILKLLAARGAGFDIVSGGELERVLAAAPEAVGRVVFSGVGKTAAEIDLALKAGILEFNVESEAELALLARARGEAEDEGAVCAAGESRCVCGYASLHFDRIAGAQIRHRYSQALSDLQERGRQSLA